MEIGLIHGRMNAVAKKDALDRFSSGEAPVLVSTTVVEVRTAPEPFLGYAAQCTCVQFVISVSFFGSGNVGKEQRSQV